MAVLDAAADDDLVTRLTLCLNSDDNYAVAEFLNGSSYEYAEPLQKNLVDVVLAHPAARSVEELCLVAKECTSDPYDDGEISCNRIGAFSIIDAAPVLAAVRLESVLIDCWGYGNYIDRSDEDDPPSPPKEVATCRLRCPAATLLVLERCKWEEKDHGQHGSWPTYGGGHYDDELVSLITAEIEAPRLRRFTYKGFLRPFSFSSQPPELEQVDLEFFPYQGNENYKNREPNRVLATIWRLVRSFTSTRGMKLRLNHLEDMAVLSEARRVQLQPVFRRPERLELQGAQAKRQDGGGDDRQPAPLLPCAP
ncbi:hypothetical protein ZWY2020_040531 [Hordeum vulgare]|nr:hypothetical protein ZWY2020_040531 [Hordeum vulgare]